MKTTWMKQTPNTKSRKIQWTERVRGHINREFCKFEQRDQRAREIVAERSIRLVRSRLLKVLGTCEIK